ncbi:hypothetical protein LP7551_01441 [Roseibium album]|nr:hypothetical protein LP7551_01441 [Roseibium album]
MTDCVFQRWILETTIEETGLEINVIGLCWSVVIGCVQWISGKTQVSDTDFFATGEESC